MNLQINLSKKAFTSAKSLEQLIGNRQTLELQRKLSALSPKNQTLTETGLSMLKQQLLHNQRIEKFAA
jgi:hypothetical protein